MKLQASERRLPLVSGLRQSSSLHCQCLSMIPSILSALTLDSTSWRMGWEGDASSHKDTLVFCNSSSCECFYNSKFFFFVNSWGDWLIPKHILQSTHMHLKINSHHCLDREGPLLASVNGAVPTKSICDGGLGPHELRQTAAGALGNTRRG